MISTLAQNDSLGAVTNYYNSLPGGNAESASDRHEMVSSYCLTMCRVRGRKMEMSQA